MAKSRKILTVDPRKRVTLGSLAGEYEMYFANVDPKGVITLTPAELVPVAKPKPRRRRAATPKEQTPNDVSPDPDVRV
jgi:hypothetical protein